MTTSGSDVLACEHVTRVFGAGDGAFHALRGVSVRIRHGETVAIVGKSGSGKSTLMHILAGLDRPTSGTVAFEGRDLTSLGSSELARVRNQSFSFIFQQFHLLPRLDVAGNVGLQLKLGGVAATERRARVAQALEMVGLADKASNRATNLSGGQQQRVAVARAIVAEPRVLFADEPTGNLDSGTGESVIQLLFDLNRSLGLTLVVVTHDDDFAARCARQVVIRDGLIAADTALTSVGGGR